MEKVAFITGAGGYIGSETAVTLARQGIKIAVCDINVEAVANTVKKVEEIDGVAKGYIADVTDYENIEAAINSAADDFGGLDIMVHIAGGSARIAGGSYVPLVEQKINVVEKVLKVNLFGAIWASKTAAKIMIRQGRGGRIINFSSAVGINGLKSCTDYAASKGGVMSFTKALAKELGEYGITVNDVAPGVVQRPGDCNEAVETNFLGRKCTATDIAELVAFLASDKAGFITGQTHVCDGGRTLAMKGTD